MGQRTKITFIVLALVILAGSILYVNERESSDQADSSIYSVKAKVLAAESVETVDQYGRQRGQNLRLQILTGPERGEVVNSFNRLSANPLDFDSVLSPGDRVLLSVDDYKGVKTYYFSDYDRVPYFFILVAIFSFGLVFWGRLVGLKSLIGIAVTLWLLWKWFLTYILQPGVHVYSLALLFCVIISLIVLPVVSGINRKTGAAILGTWAGLAFASVLAYLSIRFLHLTGLNTEEAYMLKASIVPFLDFHGVLFASIIIGSLGALIDVSISIASAQYEIFQSSPDMPWQELYKKGMNVGKDIMGAMSNTLILAYVGSSFPLLLMMSLNKQVDIERVINLPIIMTELVQAIIGSIGLIYSIPITAMISAVILRYQKPM